MKKLPRIHSNFYTLIVVSSLLFLLNINAAHAADMFSGQYESLNGEFKHDFKTSGDYAGSYSGKNFPEKVKGVFSFGDGVCNLKNKNGQNEASGNLLIYYNERQCCLNLQRISDKLTVTKVWFTYEFPAGICQNQVLIKK